MGTGPAPGHITGSGTAVRRVRKPIPVHSSAVVGAGKDTASHYQSKFRHTAEIMKENASDPASLIRNSVCVCVFVLRKHLHQKQTWVCALIHVKNIQCYLQDVALAMISFSKWICEGGLPSERSALGRPCAHCNHGSSVCQLQASRC